MTDSGLILVRTPTGKEKVIFTQGTITDVVGETQTLACLKGKTMVDLRLHCSKHQLAWFDPDDEF